MRVCMCIYVRGVSICACVSDHRRGMPSLFTTNLSDDPTTHIPNHIKHPQNRRAASPPSGTASTCGRPAPTSSRSGEIIYTHIYICINIYVYIFDVFPPLSAFGVLFSPSPPCFGGAILHYFPFSAFCPWHTQRRHSFGGSHLTLH